MHHYGSPKADEQEPIHSKKHRHQEDDNETTTLKRLKILPVSKRLQSEEIRPRTTKIIRPSWRMKNPYKPFTPISLHPSSSMKRRSEDDPTEESVLSIMKRFKIDTGEELPVRRNISEEGADTYLKDTISTVEEFLRERYPDCRFNTDILTKYVSQSLSATQKRPPPETFDFYT